MYCSKRDVKQRMEESTSENESLIRPLDFIHVLLVGCLSEVYSSLKRIFRGSNWQVHQVVTYREAIAFSAVNHIAAIICERDLPDGNWKVVLSGFESLAVRPNVIVTSRLADDRLWAEVLNLGGYDVLAQPFNEEEVHRTVFLACQHLTRHNPALS